MRFPAAALAFSLAIIPFVAQAATLTIEPASQIIEAGDDAELYLTIDPPPLQDVEVTLELDDYEIAYVDETVTIRAGESEVEIEVETYSEGGPILVTARLPESLGSVEASASILVIGVAIGPEYQEVAPGDEVYFWVWLSHPQPTDITLQVSSDSPGVLGLPTTVVLPAGETDLEFVATTLVPEGEAEVRVDFPEYLAEAYAAAYVVITENPATIVIDEWPEVLIGYAGDTQPLTTTYVLTNIGDQATTITLDQSGDFFTQSPELFTLAPESSQVVTITALPRPPGEYEGESRPMGSGLPEGLEIDVDLFVEEPPSGTPDAAAESNRVDVSAPVGINPAGSVRFTNKGSGNVVGVLQSDNAWITPQAGRVTIAPGATGEFSFTVDRTQQFGGAAELGTDKGTLSLVYLQGSGSSGKQTMNGGPSLATPVTVVDTTKPAASAGGIPPLVPGEIAFFIGGVGHVTGGAGRLFISDLAIVNQGRLPLPALNTWYRPAGATAQGQVSQFSAVGGNSSIQLADIVSTVFGQDAQVGTFQTRTTTPALLSLTASVFNANNPKGTYGTALPVFRSDRSAIPGQELWITGLAKDAGSYTNFYLQETGGIDATVSIELRDRTGAVLDRRDGVSVPAFGLTSITDIAKEGAVVARVLGITGGQVMAFATPVDNVSGDTWALADWGKVSGAAAGQEQIVPVAGSAPGANNTFFRTDLAVTNAGAAPVSVNLRYFRREGGAPVEKAMTLAAGHTEVLTDVVGTFLGVSNTVGFMRLTGPAGSSIVMTSRTYTTAGAEGTFGTAVPTLTSSFALGAGKSRTFGGLPDTNVKTVNLATPGTFRTNFGFVEVDGQPALVRVSALYANGLQLASGGATASLDIQVGAGEFRLYNGMLKAILGPGRDTTLDDVANVQLRFDVLSGSGRIIPFVTTTDNGTGDTVMQVE
ncbi:MAG: hypothetical protein ACSLFQ_11340 [Thermoanaerobaculia bacterium]